MHSLTCFIFSSFQSFGGYGASISYSDASAVETSKTVSSSVDFSVVANVNVGIKFAVFSIGPTINLGLNGGGGFTKGSSSNHGISKSRSRGFSLSDSDEYDSFDVQV